MAAFKTIEKNIEIHAPAPKVWDVLLLDRYNRIWYAEFSEGTYAETDWQVGSKAVFKDSSGSGMACKIVTNQPYERLSIQFQGMITGDKEDNDSEEAKSIQGAYENYVLSEKDGVTLLSIASDMSPEMFDTMSTSWEKALVKIKALAEGE